MLNFKFELTPYPGEEIDGLTQGHLVISGAKGSLNLKEFNETIMVFITIENFLWQIQRLVTEKKIKSDFFNGVDSSIFSFTIKKGATDQLSLIYGDITIDTVRAQELITAFWNGVEIFLNQNLKYITPDDIVFEDLKSAVLDFTSTFKIKQIFFV